MSTVKRRKLSWFGHVCSHDTLLKIILQVPWMESVTEVDRESCERTTSRNGQASQCHHCSALQRTGIDGRPLEPRLLSGCPNDAWASRVLIDWFYIQWRTSSAECIGRKLKVHVTWPLIYISLMPGMNNKHPVRTRVVKPTSFAVFRVPTIRMKVTGWRSKTIVCHDWHASDDLSETRIQFDWSFETSI